MANGVPELLQHYGPHAPVVLEQPLPRAALPTPALVLQRTANFGRCVACFKRTAVPTPEKATQPSRGAWSCMPWHPPMLH